VFSQASVAGLPKHAFTLELRNKSVRDQNHEGRGILQPLALRAVDVGQALFLRVRGRSPADK
jgi:hypothetical protein